MLAQHDEAAQVPYSFSAGVASLSRVETINDLLKEADENLYYAKRSGRTCIAFEGRIVSSNAVSTTKHNQATQSVEKPTHA